MSKGEYFIVDAQHCAALFRLGRDVEAGIAMTELLGALQSVIDQAAPSVQQQWVVVLGPMLECQESQNWLALADYLEYELVQVLTDGLSI